jgi:cell division transport system permease protein
MQAARPLPPRSRPNYLYAIASVALVLFALGGTGLLLLHAQRILRYYEENVNLILEFEDTVSPTAQDSLLGVLERAGYVLPGSVRFISRAQAAELMRKDFGEEFLSLDMPNPFYDIATFNVRAGYMNPGALGDIRDQWRAAQGIHDLYYQEGVLIPVSRNLKKTGTALLLLGTIALIIVSILIHNTIRLALYANRFLIKTMELVGASWGFISKPYLWRAFVHGAISGLLAVVGLTALLYWVDQNMPGLDLGGSRDTTVLLFAALPILGAGVYLFSTWIVVNKYLRLRMDDLY